MHGADLEPIFEVPDMETCQKRCNHNPHCMGYDFIDKYQTFGSQEIIQTTGREGYHHCKLKPFSRAFDGVFDDTPCESDTGDLLWDQYYPLSGKHGRCNICDGTYFFGYPNATVDMMFLEEDTCEQYYYKAMQGSFGDESCKLLQDMLPEYCGCQVGDTGKYIWTRGYEVEMLGKSASCHRKVYSTVCH